MESFLRSFCSTMMERRLQQTPTTLSVPSTTTLMRKEKVSNVFVEVPSNAGDDTLGYEWFCKLSRSMLLLINNTGLFCIYLLVHLILPHFMMVHPSGLFHKIIGGLDSQCGFNTGCNSEYVHYIGVCCWNCVVTMVEVNAGLKYTDHYYFKYTISKGFNVWLVEYGYSMS